MRSLILSFVSGNDYFSTSCSFLYIEERWEVLKTCKERRPDAGRPAVSVIRLCAPSVSIHSYIVLHIIYPVVERSRTDRKRSPAVSGTKRTRSRYSQRG